MRRRTPGPTTVGPGVCDVLGHHVVGVTGFEPAASSSRTTRATKLRHTPKAVASLLERIGCSEPGFRHPPEGAQELFGSRVSRVASGRQNSRIGAYGEVPAPAETCNHDEPLSPGRESAGCRCRPLARLVSRSQLVTMAPLTGRQTCPPWVCPAKVRS